MRNLADKDAAGIAAELRDCIDVWWLTSIEVRVAGAARDWRGIGPQISVPIDSAEDVAAACSAAIADAGAADRIVVFGSFHAVGPSLDWLEAHDMLPPETFPNILAAPRT